MSATSNANFHNDSVMPELVSRRASEIAPEHVRWICKKRIAAGKLTLVAGDPGVSKSLFAYWIAAQITCGGSWPCGEGKASVGSVIILAAEDGIADTIVPRLTAA